MAQQSFIAGHQAADGQSKDQAAPAIAFRVKQEIQGHEGEATTGMSGRKTLLDLFRPLALRVTFKNSDVGNAAAISGDVSGACHIRRGFHDADDRGHDDEREQYDTQPPVVLLYPGPVPENQQAD